MMSNDNGAKKFRDSISSLEHALEFEKECKKDRFYFAGISKCFEVCLEYAWKYFRQCAADEGLKVYSPKEAIKTAGRLELIENVEVWLDFLNTRNIAVHDYLSVSDEDYLDIVKKFLKEVKKISLK